jgi:outer membrane protein TolC
MTIPKRKMAALALAIAAVALPLRAQESSTGPRKIGVDEAVALAEKSDEGLAQAAIALQAKSRALGLVWNNFLPSVAVSAGVADNGTSTNAGSNQLAATGGVSASLNLSAATGDARRLSKLEYERQILAYEKAKASLELSIRKEAYTILLDEERLKQARQNIERESESYAQTEAKYKAGLASEIDLLSANVSLESLKPTADGYATTLANDLDSLESVLGLPADEEITIWGGLEAEDRAIARLLEEATASKDEDNRGVAAAAKSLELARLTKSSLSASKLLPSLALSASLTPNLPMASFPASSQASSSVTASAILSLSLDNFLPGSAAQESIAEAQDSIANAESALREAIRDARVARKSDARSVEDDRSSLAALKLNVQLAEKSYAASREAYNRGYLTLTSLQSAAGDLDSAKLTALSKSYDLISAALDLAFATGLPLNLIGKE